jgi:hypothetical protein
MMGVKLVERVRKYLISTIHQEGSERLRLVDNLLVLFTHRCWLFIVVAIS